ncbi:hypothetical protein SAMN04488519_10497 [Algoriphagus ornithinivorans]|uniref:Uncharacterized protein n=1 Tax=Algoriphagus ornithinivorans TaxID=226506 RepID=A0A1I5EWA3_9BACT|nr:hypothetical protein [Algoriphagus ornithinivorans]SFO15670.1 hypothetical protein SAMN04488519_10497 [Algoriphagus ornithinivorans]
MNLKNNKKTQKITKIFFLLMMVLTFSCVENENLPMNQNQELIIDSEESSLEYGFKMVSQSGLKLASALSFDKCYTIRNNVNGIDEGFGYYGNTTLPKYGMGNVRFYFTLETL